MIGDSNLNVWFPVMKQEYDPFAEDVDERYQGYVLSSERREFRYIEDRSDAETFCNRMNANNHGFGVYVNI